MTATAGRKADFYVTSGAPVAFPANDPMSDISANSPGALARTVYANSAPARRYFDPTVAPTFQISLNSGTSWNPVTPDNLDAGLISFIAQQQASPAAMFRIASGNYLPYSRVGGGHEWDLNPLIDIFDVTEFGQTSKHHITGQAGGTVSVKRWYMDDTLRSVLGNLIVVVLYTDATAQPSAPRYEFYARLRADALKVVTRQAEEEDLTFEIQSDVTFLSA